MGIRKLNNYFYELEEINNVNQENNNSINQNEDIARNVWIVSIKHKENISKNIEEFFKNEDKEYYIDITTGEIIGGKRIYQQK